MIYAVYHGVATGKPLGFITEQLLHTDDEVPKYWDTIDHAQASMQGHPLYEAGRISFVEIEDL
jgi:hypothetical protein